MSISNYPDSAIEYLQEGDIYSVYFVPYIILVITIIIPIPTAVVFDRF